MQELHRHFFLVSSDTSSDTSSGRQTGNQADRQARRTRGGRGMRLHDLALPTHADCLASRYIHRIAALPPQVTIIIIILDCCFSVLAAVILNLLSRFFSLKSTFVPLPCVYFAIAGVAKSKNTFFPHWISRALCTPLQTVFKIRLPSHPCQNHLMHAQKI